MDNTFEGLPLYKISVDDEEYGATMMSLVLEPAVDSNFLIFSKENNNYFTFNKEKRLITGVALRANYPIVRYEGDSKYYIQFDKDTIYKTMEKFMKEQKTKSVNLQHSEDTNNVYLIESYILNEKHKLDYPEFNEIEEGSWIVTYKVENDSVWEDIKNGNIKGFSIEMFAKVEEANKYNQDLKNKVDKITKLINYLEDESNYKS